MLKIRSTAAARAAARQLRASASRSSNTGTPVSAYFQLNNSIHPPFASGASHFITRTGARDFLSSSIRLFSTCSIANSSASVDNADADSEADAAAAYLTMRNAAMDDAFHAIELALDSVVKIFTVASSPSYFLPWQNKSQRESMGSGFVISGRRILTNAHVVADHTFVLVRKHGSPAKYRAHVQAVGHECDLAILMVESEEFWEGVNCLELGDVPFLQESVAVVGYPQGGDNISVTKGVVSRVEPTQYVHGATQLLAIQIDAAINPGNSGGPAIMGDKVAGVAFQNLSNAENIGYIIPVPVIKRFIEGVEETGDYVGFCSMGLSCQATENAQLRDHFKMRPGLTGVLVNRINPISDAYRVLKKDDIILSFDVSFRNRERITFDHLVSMKKPDDTAKVKVLRDGEEYEFTVALRPLQPLVPVHQFDQLPSYFIFAGLVFVPLTQPYLHEYGEDWYNTSPRRLCERALKELPQKDGQQLVILSQVLVDDINTGYERLAEFQVKKVNGVEVDNLKHLRQLVEDGSSENIRFDLDDERVIVLNYEKARIATSRILNRHRIPSATSADLIDDHQTVSDIQLP
ncbi:protease Do-like 10, mitochondrial isoform X2 [Salvia splendens]|uniref:protease Do-like 10, mitochondrial isoform X2 n=1 Tax=Salvia splendens TaxID=180675 RepID=UPI001C2796E0|nr:protease Do-like 10, mitochondrial isoform X2 [Salvia splendens]